MFRSCGESEGGDAVRVVAGQVLLVAVAFFVVVHVVAGVAVDDDSADFEDGFGSAGGPPGGCVFLRGTSLLQYSHKLGALFRTRYLRKSRDTPQKIIKEQRSPLE